MPELPIFARVKDGFTAPLKKLRSGFGQVAKASEASASRSIRVFRAFRGSIAGTAGALFSLKAAIVGAGLGFLAKSVIDAGSAVENATARLVGIRGGLEQATEAMGFFREVATEVPFTLQAVVDAGVALEAFGARSEEALRPVADLAAFMGTTIPEAAQAFGRAFAGGAGAADILRERGVLAAVKLKLGIEDLTKLTLPKFRKALISAFTDPLGPIAGAAKRLSKTFSGQISIMSDAIENLKIKIGEAGVLKFAKNVIKELTLAVRALTEAFDPTNVNEFTDSLDAFAPSANKIIGAVLFLNAAVDTLLLPLKAVIVAFAQLNVWAERASAGMSNFNGNLVKAEEFLRLSKKDFENTANAIEGATDKFAEITSTVRKFREELVESNRELAASENALKDLALSAEALKKSLQLAPIEAFQRILGGATDFTGLLTDAQEELVFAFIKAERAAIRLSDSASEAASGPGQVALITIARFQTLSDEGKRAVLSIVGAAKRTLPGFATAFTEATEKAFKAFETKIFTDKLKGVAQELEPALAKLQLLPPELEEQFDLLGERFRRLSATAQENVLMAVNAVKGGAVKQLAVAEAATKKEEKAASDSFKKRLQVAQFFTTALGNLTEAAGIKSIAINKAISVANAAINTAVAITKAFAELGPIGGAAAAPVLAAIGAAQIAAILAAKPGGGGGGDIGGGAGFAVAPEGPAVEAAAPSVPSVTINLGGAFIGDEALLASELGRIFREAVGDDVETGIEVR